MSLQRLRGAVILLTLAALAFAPAYASAAVDAPIGLGAGQNPNVTLGPDGTAYIAYTGAGANSKELDFCRLPRGATACATKSLIPAPGDSLSIPLPFVGDDGTVHVISFRYGGDVPGFAAVYVFRSSDGGATFDTGAIIGSNLPPNDFAFGPGDNVSGINSASACGTCFQAWPLTGGVATGPAVLSGDHPYNGALALIDPNTPLAVFADGSGNTQFRRYTGVGDVNDANTWTPAVDIGTSDYPRLVDGPSGVIMISQDQLSGPNMQARRYNGTTFGAPVKITDGTRADHATQDAAGRTHVVGGRFSGTKTNSSLFYATSDDGVSWQTENIDTRAVPGVMRLAVAADHFGTVVGTLADNSGVFAAGIGPRAAEPTTAKFVSASLVSGTVLIQVPPSKKFVPLRKGDVIPIGSIVDATKGRVRITIALPNGTLQPTDFFQGVFKVTQAKSGLATMVLVGGSFKSCGGKTAAVHAAKAKVVRQLWGAGSGKFRTKGRYAAASIRGTTWDTIDRCDGTLVRVTKGRVAVTNLKTKKTTVIKAGHSLLVKA